MRTIVSGVHFALVAGLLLLALAIELRAAPAAEGRPALAPVLAPTPVATSEG